MWRKAQSKENRTPDPAGTNQLCVPGQASALSGSPLRTRELGLVQGQRITAQNNHLCPSTAAPWSLLWAEKEKIS